MVLSLELQLKTILQELVQKAFAIHLDLNLIKIEIPPKKEMGDFAAALGFLLAKELKQNPFEIVSTLANLLKEDSRFLNPCAAKPGFLNFFLAPFFLHNLTTEFLNNPKALSFQQKTEKIFLEYVSANPTGPLHIGHGRWAALGDSLARLLQHIGYEVHREFYVNDAGNQINNLNRSVDALKKGEPVPEDGYHGAYLKDALLFNGPAHHYFLSQQKETLKEFRCQFDCFYSEQSLHDGNEISKAINTLKDQGYLYQEEGALWFKSTLFGDDKDRVLIKNDGAYTYFAPDIAYHLTKINRGGQWIIDILGADHHGYVNRITAAVLALSQKKARMDVIIGQLVSLYRGGEPVRMSKRTGDMITLQEVIEEIGVDALRYILVSKKHSQTIDFDLEKVKEQNKENPVFYIQYAFARINSIFKNLKDIEFNLNPNLDALLPYEKDLLILALQLKDEIQTAALQLDPSKLANYLFELAVAFHGFYEKSRVLDQGKVIAYRVIIIKAVALALKKGLNLLGMDSPEKM